MKNTSNKYDNLVNPEVYKHISPKTSVLDVGCWKGDLGKKLIKDKKCVVEGIEIDDRSIKQAKRNGINRVYKIDLNYDYEELKKIKNKYDYIILADVIEHLLNPEKVLIELKSKLKVNGKLIISTPNIAFVLYRLLLLIGKFDYVNGPGVMDITHTRFFTIDSLKKTLVSCGYKVNTCYGYSIVNNKFFFLRILAKFVPKLFGIQIFANAS